MQGQDYIVNFNSEDKPVITAITGIPDGVQLEISYTVLAPENVSEFDIIGGYNMQTGRNEGLELVNNVFTMFGGLVPGQIVVPKFSGNPMVAAVMDTRASNINGVFKAISLHDIPTMINGSQHRFQDVPEWVQNNNFVSTSQYNLYGCHRLEDHIFYPSVQTAGLIGETDADNRGIPYESPSNNNLRINGLCYEDGTELQLSKEQAKFLETAGVASAINFIGGWRLFGNRTGAFTRNTDPKDTFLSIRRMFNWIGNSIVLTHWRKIDKPVTIRLIESVVDSVNLWFNGLQSNQYILGGRIEFRRDNNPTTAMLDGMFSFDVFVSPPPPFAAADFTLEYDPEYLNNLFV